MSILESRARLFATAAHAAVRQVRKYTGEVYITHPAAVVEIIRSVPHSEEMIAAAWLHDVVEDTEVEVDLIETEFGPVVADLICWLTTPWPPSAGTRAVRKTIDREKLAMAPAEAQTIKLADMIDNTATIAGRDPDFAQVYLKEQRLLLDALTRGNPTLIVRARRQLGLVENQLVSVES